ncbi:hypothetical protein [Kitasatospora aureofaciens]|uniref:hypothetical protein n=1 Tax=Kitasatospora aureofaciens TaxID=1894 RepID=UPI00340A27E6
MSTIPDTDDPDLSPERRQDLLELAEFLGLQEEAEGLRGDMRTEQILPRLKRALDLAGLPISTGTGTPGVTVTLLPTASVGWPAGSLAVEWRVGADLDALDQDADAGDPVDSFARTVTEGMEAALAAILRKAGLRIITDSQFGGAIVAGVMPAKGTDTLGL